MKLQLRLVALVAMIVTVLFNTGCANAPHPYISGSKYNRIVPAQQPVEGIERNPKGSGAECARDFATISLPVNDTVPYGNTLLTTRWQSDASVFVTSTEGFRSIVAGVVVSDDGSRTPFSTRVEGFNQESKSFVVLAEDFDAANIDMLELCAFSP